MVSAGIVNATPLACAAVCIVTALALALLVNVSIPVALPAIPNTTPPVPCTVNDPVKLAADEMVWPLKVPVQAKLPFEFVNVQPVEPDPPPRSILPVDVPPMLIVPLVAASRVRFWAVPPADIARPDPLPLIAVPDTLRLFTAVPLREPPVMVAPLIVELQANTPVALVTVQPVLPDPPPIRMSPVLVPPISTWPDVEPFRLRFWAVPPAATARALLPVTEATPVRAPALDTFKPVEAIVRLSRAEPRTMVSAVVLLLPMLIALPAVPVPILIVLALLPVPRFTVPVVPESKVTALLVLDVRVRVEPPVTARPADEVRVGTVTLVVTATVPVKLAVDEMV